MPGLLLYWRIVTDPGGRAAYVARRGRYRAKVKHLPRQGWQVFVQGPGDAVMRRLRRCVNERAAFRVAERWLREQGAVKIRSGRHTYKIEKKVILRGWRFACLMDGTFEQAVARAKKILNDKSVVQVRLGEYGKPTQVYIPQWL